MRSGLLEAVPNFSEGRDLEVVDQIVAAVRGAGAEVLDWSADHDHNRSVVTFVGRPGTVVRAALAAARVAVERIDLREHQGVHPRVGALDVLPFVPLAGLTLDDAREIALEVGERLADEVGVPIFYYGEASDPRGRRLGELRRGGFEGLVDGWPEGREADLLPSEWRHPGAHPTAGVTCVGARPLLLAWNVNIMGVEIEWAREIANSIRERGGGFPGLRALALELRSRNALQISMNLEDPGLVSPFEIYRRIEEEVMAAGGSIIETEVIGMIPDELIVPAAAARLRLAGVDEGGYLPEGDRPGAGGHPVAGGRLPAGELLSKRLLSRRLLEYLVSPGQEGERS